MTLTQLLAAPVAYVEGVPVTVYDTVDYAANVAGGVHLGDPNKKNRAITKALAESLAVNGSPWTFTALVRVGESVLDGVSPFLSAIRAD